VVDDRPPGSRRVHPGRTIFFRLAILAGGAVLIVGQSWLSRESKPAPLARSPAVTIATTRADPERVTGYVGAAGCRECHPGESALFARSGHHRTVWPAEAGRNPVVAWLDGKTWKDPDVPDVTWSYHLRDGGLVADRIVDGRTETLRI